MTTPEHPTLPGGWIIAAAAAAAAVFLLDLRFPLGYAVPMLYVLPILMTRLIPGWQSTVVMGGSVLILTWLGTYSSSGELTVEAVVNRIMASGLLLVVCGLLLRQKQLAQRAAVAQGARRESEEQLRLFIEYAPAAIAMFDTEMRYLATSRRWLADYGLTGQEVQRRSHYDLFPEIPERWKAIHRRCLAGAVERAEDDLFARADGSRQWLRWEVRPWYRAPGGVGGIIIFTEDITERKRVDQALRESEERFRHIFLYAGTGIAITDMDGRFVRCNPAFSAMTGYREEELALHAFPSLIHPEDREENMRIVDSMPEYHQSTVEIEIRYVHKSGHPVWVRQFDSVLRNHDGRPTHVIILVTDISERKRAEEELRRINATLDQRVRERTAQLAEANERWAWVTRATQDGVWDWDLVYDVAYFSPRWKAMHGFQDSDRLESFEEWSARIHPEDRGRVLAQVRFYLDKQLPEYWEEYRIQRKDGTYIWVLDRGIALWDERGRAYRMVGAETDITWRKEAEEALRRREREFRALADNVPAYFSYIGADRRYRYVNKRYEELFHRPHHEIIGMAVRDLLGPDSYAGVEGRLEAALAGQEVAFEYPLSVPGGSEHWFSARYVPDRDEQGHVAGLFALQDDVTAIKSYDAALREREAQLRDLSHKLLEAQEEERRRIASEVHDDFTQRLAALTMELHSLEREWPGSGPAVSERLLKLGAQAERLTGDLEQLAHYLHPSILEHAGLEAAVREQVEEFAERVGLSAEIMVKDVQRPVPLEEATCLYRVLQESLQNVRKHAKATTVLVRLLGTPRGVGLCIHDDGKGFEQDQTGVSRKGLGLTSMEERVKRLKGTFRIRTKPGDGTEVHAWVPLDEVKRDA